jgi:protease-4
MSPQAVDAIGRGHVWTGAQAVGLKLVDHIGGLRAALNRAIELGHLPADAPIVELPEEDDSILGFLLNLAGLSAKDQASVAAALVPGPMLDLARSLSPFFVFDSNKPLARMELVDDISFSAPTTANERERLPAGEP